MCVTLTTCDEQRAAVGAPELANAMERTAETTDGFKNSRAGFHAFVVVNLRLVTFREFFSEGILHAWHIKRSLFAKLFHR